MEICHVTATEFESTMDFLVSDLLLVFLNHTWALMKFWTLRVGAYSRWALIRGWVVIKFQHFQQV